MLYEESITIDDLNPNPANPDYYGKRLVYDVDLRDIFFNSYEKIFLTDGEGKILLLNPVAEEHLGFCLTGYGDITIQECVDLGILDHSLTIEAIRQRKRITGLVRTSSGQSFMTTSTPILDKEGNVRLVLSNSRKKDNIDDFLANLVAAHREEKTQFQTALSYLGDATIKSQQFVAESPSMKSLLRLARAVAKTSSSILLLGESGTGKDMLAHFIHSQSATRDKAFIPVNCAAIPHELLESEFFGYEQGAFTGARQRGKPGFFEIANGGILFLDEIGELPLALQSKLLRVLENGEVQRIGAVDRRHVTVRVIAATNKDLKQMVRKGTFREDLFYRLNVIPIMIPPLRKRKEDILPLAQVFLDDICRKNIQKKCMSSDVKDMLLAYHWPGNIRELRNIVERLAVISETPLIDTAVWEAMSMPFPMKHSPPNAEGTQSFKIVPLRQFQLESEEKYLRHVYSACNGNVQLMADTLQVHRTGLYRKLKALDMTSRPEQNPE